MAVNASLADFAPNLVRWQRRHGRHVLPWQSQPPDPYRVWVSEIMLQQTQVQTVIPYFERFMQRFPNLASLARADEHDVLALWSGLGYYRRARHLHACAQTLMQQHHGGFPSRADELSRLPGIGPSTAAAIASIVFGERVAILDGNVKRVLARLFCVDAPWASPALESALGHKAQQLLPADAALMPAYTQAIMDLGALICKVKDPACIQCPVRKACQAHARDRVHHYPRPRRARQLVQHHLYWAVLIDQEAVWLMRQPDDGIWPALWLPWTLDPKAVPQHWNQVAPQMREVISMRCVLTHRRLEISAGIFDWGTHRAPQGAPTGLRRFAWQDAMTLPLPAPVRRLLLKLCPSGKASDGAQRRNTRL